MAVDSAAPRSSAGGEALLFPADGGKNEIAPVMAMVGGKPAAEVIEDHGGSPSGREAGSTPPWWRQWFAATGVTRAAVPHAPGLSLDSQVVEGAAALAGQGVALLNAISGPG